ncbi:MAG: DNA-binding response regulator [Bacteroidetes bacterium]|nr:MAG: DNA-binding response regulator [Bacteroidota bacterium]
MPLSHSRTRPATPWTAYVVDDDDLFRESIERNLLAAGYHVRAFASGHDFLSDIAAAPRPGVVLLDWKMPSINGIEVLRRLRESGVDLPVIFLTVLGDQIYEEAALTGGAIDFIEKSRSFAIVQRRMEIILSGMRQTMAAGQPPADLHLGALDIDGASRRVRWRGADVGLTLTEYRLVRFMAEQAGRDVGYRELYDLVHGQGFSAGEGEHGYRANVRAFIKRIRQKFRALDSDFDAIANYPGFGYRWIAPGAGAGAAS